MAEIDGIVEITQGIHLLALIFNTDHMFTFV